MRDATAAQYLAAGCSFVRIDGKAFPYTPDKLYFTDFTFALHYMAMHYWYSRDEAVARAAGQMTAAFFLDPATGMNPSMAYAQIVRGSTNPKQTAGKSALIDARFLLVVHNAALLFERAASPGWRERVDGSALRRWFRGMARWITSSPQGKEALAATNNLQTWTRAQLVAYWSFSGNLSAARRVYDGFVSSSNWRNSVAADGTQKWEIGRADSFHYGGFCLMLPSRDRFATNIIKPTSSPLHSTFNQQNSKQACLICRPCACWPTWAASTWDATACGRATAVLSGALRTFSCAIFRLIQAGRERAPTTPRALSASC